jgi:hypothetical protein
VLTPPPHGRKLNTSGIKQRIQGRAEGILNKDGIAESRHHESCATLLHMNRRSSSVSSEVYECLMHNFCLFL